MGREGVTSDDWLGHRARNRRPLGRRGRDTAAAKVLTRRPARRHARGQTGPGEVPLALRELPASQGNVCLEGACEPFSR